MPKNTPDKGVQPFELRPGEQFKRLRGMNRSADPASIPDDQFHLLTNVRLTPAGMIDRPGLLAASHTSPQGAGCITGMIEVEETGVGLVLTPSPGGVGSYLGGHVESATFPGEMQLGIFNEEESGTVDYGAYDDREDQRADFRRYNDEDLDDPPKSDAGLAASITPPIPRSGDFQNYAVDGTFASLFKYRKRLLQFGHRTKLDPVDQSAERWACLFQVTLPEEKSHITAGYQLAGDLWQVELAQTELEVSDAVTVFGRDDDPQSDEERITEVLYIGRKDGRVYSFDGTTLKEEVSIGTDVAVRLAVFNGIGVLAIGSDNPVTTTLARFLDAPGGTWTSVVVPDNIQVSDMISWGGAIYIASSTPSGNPGGWAGPRIYKFSGSTPIPAAIFEFAPVVANASNHLGLFFVRDGILNVIYNEEAGREDWFVYHRVSDGTWTQYTTKVNSGNAGDFPDTQLYWVLTTGNQRVILGGLWYDDVIDEQYSQAIVELSDWEASGPDSTTLYVNIIPTEEGPAVGAQALMVAPEDVALNEEEL